MATKLGVVFFLSIVKFLSSRDILIWENKQIQTSKNIPITAQTPFTTIEVVGYHGEEAGGRDSSEQLCSVDHVHIR